MKNSPRTYVIADYPEIQGDLQRLNIEPEEFGDRIIFMSMFNDIEWTVKGNEGN